MARAFSILFVMVVGCSADEEPLPTACAPERDPADIAVAMHVQSQLLDQSRGEPAWLAVQDGGPECPWQVVDAGSLAVTHERYAVAVACIDPSVAPRLVVIGRTLADGNALAVTCGHRYPDPLAEHAHAINAAVDAGEPVGVQSFMHADSTLHFEIATGSGGITTTWFANAGRHDLVTIGHRGLDPDAGDRVQVVRDLDPLLDPTVQISPATAPNYLPFDPPVTMTSPDAVALRAEYVTSNGTFVLLGIDANIGPTTLAFPSWPASGHAAGDVYVQSTIDSDGIDTRVGQRFATTPETTAPVLPDKLVAARAAGGVSLRQAPGATGYAIECVGGDRELVYDVSAGWLGGDAVYVFPVLPDDPVVPAVLRSPPDCTLTASAYTASGGLAGQALVDAIGREPGAPARLAGTTRSIARHRL